MYLIKLGGSALTYKGARPRLRRKVLTSLAAELAPFGRDLCLVHGGGSFGHPLAYAHGLHRGLRGDDGVMAFAAVQRRMRDLNGHVLDGLHAAGLPAVSVPPAPLVRMHAGELESLATRPFREALKAGLVPVTFGDAALDTGQGAAICSGDDLMVHLARALRPDLALFVADVEGIVGPEGRVLAVIRGEVPNLTWKAPPEDVTGGMRAKVQRMLDIAREGARCLLVSGLVPGRVAAALDGKPVPSTEVRWSG
ncbi:MAG: isopentenyl phosphate kinase [Thermoplasmata archaeon]